MALLWDGVPAFKAGQHLSATGQLNALSAAAGLLFDRVTGYGAPFCGASSDLDGAGGMVWAIRHKHNLLDWRLELNGTAYLRYNGIKLNGTEHTTGSLQYVSGTENLSSLGLTVNQFYTLDLVLTSGYCRVWNLCERADSSFPTLASFADGTTPTEQQWTDLATYLTLMHQETALPRPLFAGRPGEHAFRFWFGTGIHQAETLAYQIKVQTSYNKCPSGSWYARAYLRAWSDTVGGQVLATLTNTNRAANIQTYTGTVDLASYGFARGQNLYLAVDMESCDVADSYRKGAVEYIHELADTAPGLTDWTTPPTWAHPQYAANVATLRNSIVALRAGYKPINVPVLKARAVVPEHLHPYQARRVHRWLHYVCDSEEAQPRLTWSTDKSLSLTPKTTWQAADLAGQEDLYPGTFYMVSGVKFAIEDAEP